MNYDPGSFGQPKNHSQGPEEAADPGRDASFRLLFLNKFWSSGTYPNVQNIFAAASCTAVAMPVSPVRVSHLLLVNFGLSELWFVRVGPFVLKARRTENLKVTKFPPCPTYAHSFRTFCWNSASWQPLSLPSSCCSTYIRLTPWKFRCIVLESENGQAEEFTFESKFEPLSSGNHFQTWQRLFQEASEGFDGRTDDPALGAAL